MKYLFGLLFVVALGCGVPPPSETSAQPSPISPAEQQRIDAMNESKDLQLTAADKDKLGAVLGNYPGADSNFVNGLFVQQAGSYFLIPEAFGAVNQPQVAAILALAEYAVNH